jgi:cytochrome c
MGSPLNSQPNDAGDVLKLTKLVSLKIEINSMKKILFTGVVTIALAALATGCGGGAKTEEKPAAAADAAAAPAPATNDLSSNPDYKAGLALVGKSDCLTCHKVNDKLIGPSYKEVAAKYENTEANVKMLAEKIIKGGKGNWGEVPMTPHPAVSQADAEQMVKYVLLLKK